MVKVINLEYVIKDGDLEVNSLGVWVWVGDVRLGFVLGGWIKALFTRDIFTHNIAIKIYFDFSQ